MTVGPDAVSIHNAALLNEIERGDAIKFRRGALSHMAIYIGGGEVVHYDENRVITKENLIDCGNRFGTAEVVCNDFSKVAEKSKARNNNGKDGELQPFDREMIVGRARSRLGETGYNMPWKSCEHFASWCRYGEECNKQRSSGSLMVVAIDFGTSFSGWAYSFLDEFHSLPMKSRMILRCKDEATKDVWKNVLLMNWDYLKQNILPSEDLLSRLVVNEIISKDEVEKIGDNHTCSERNDCLLRALRRSGHRAFESFIKVLKPDYNFLADRLEVELAKAMQAAEEQMQPERKRKYQILDCLGSITSTNIVELVEVKRAYYKRVLHEMLSFPFRKIGKCDTKKEILQVYHNVIEQAVESIQNRDERFDDGAKQRKSESVFVRIKEEHKTIEVHRSVDKAKCRGIFASVCGSWIFSSFCGLDLAEDVQPTDGVCSSSFPDSFNIPRTRDVYDEKNTRWKRNDTSVEGRRSGSQGFSWTRLCFALILSLLCTTSCSADPLLSRSTGLDPSPGIASPLLHRHTNMSNDIIWDPEIYDSDNIICPEGCEMFVEMTYGVSDIHWRRVTYCYYGLVVTKPFEGYSRWHETELESTYDTSHRFCTSHAFLVNPVDMTFWLFTLPCENNWLEPDYSRISFLHGCIYPNKPSKDTGHNFFNHEQVTTSNAKRWYCNIENGYYEEDGNMFCGDDPTKPFNCNHKTYQNEYLMRQASSFERRSDTLRQMEYTHGLQPTGCDRVRHQRSDALWMSKILHMAVHAVKVKHKKIFATSEHSLKCSSIDENWGDFSDTSNDIRVVADNKWIIQMVILCMTYFMTKQTLSGEPTSIPSGKLSRVGLIVFLTASLFDGSSATSLKVFKSSEIESVGEGQGAITRLVQDKLSGLADVDLCCSICKPSIMKMDCDRFCDRPCPKENVGKKEMKSSTENRLCADVLKWILIISVIGLVILVAHLNYFSRVQSHLSPSNSDNCVKDTHSTGQSQLNGFGCHLDTCWFFVALQKLLPKYPPSNDKQPHFTKCVTKFLQWFFGGHHPIVEIKVIQQDTAGKWEKENLHRHWQLTTETQPESGDQLYYYTETEPRSFETEWIQSKGDTTNQSQQKNDDTCGNASTTTSIFVKVGDSNERERNDMISTAVENENNRRLKLYLNSDFHNPESCLSTVLGASLIEKLASNSWREVPIKVIVDIIEQSKESETKQSMLTWELADAAVMSSFHGNILNSHDFLLTEMARSFRLADVSDDCLFSEVKYSIKAEKLQSNLQVLQYRLGLSRRFSERMYSIMPKIMIKIKGRNKQHFTKFLQQARFTVPIGLRSLARLKYYRKYTFVNDGYPLMLSKSLKRKREQTLNSGRKKGKTSHITSCSDENDSQADNYERSTDSGQIRQALVCYTSQESTDTTMEAINDEIVTTVGASVVFGIVTDDTLYESITNESAADLPNMKDLKALKQNMCFEDEQSISTFSMTDDGGIQHYERTQNRCHDLPLRNYGNGIENPELPSPVTSRDSQSGWKREENSIASLRIRTIQPLGIEARTHARELLTQYNKLYQHDYVDKKGKDEDDCHALRQATWLSGEDLPIPDLDYTVAVVHSPAQKILERLANGEHVGAHESMKYEILRVCTYRNYPGEDKPFRIQLASAGWYFASDGDEVVCYCCGLRKSGWKEIDNPMKIHELLRPTCDYLVKQSEVNIPIPELSPENATRFIIFESNESDSTRRSRQGEGASNYDSDSSNPQYRFFTPPPKHPQYAEISTRLDTFKKWPTNIPQTAQIMAECGYYYAGFGDCVRCFHCGIGLRHWTEDDYPWVEHARWSKDCAYLRRMKGEEFIHNVHLAIDNDEEPEDLVPETPSGRPADMSQVTPNEDSSQILLTDPAQSVLTMGYQPRIIKRAIDVILHNEGRPGITAQKIMETIFMLEERDETNLQEELARINISNASGGPDTPLKDTPNTAVGNAASGQAHGRAHSEGKDKAKKDQRKDVKHQSKEKNDKGESQKSPEKHNEATAQSEEGGASESKSKVKDTSKIKAENRKLKEQTVCKICLDKPVSIVFLPCGHLVTCAECAPAMRKCPICRALVKGRVKAFMS